MEHPFRKIHHVAKFKVLQLLHTSWWQTSRISNDLNQGLFATFCVSALDYVEVKSNFVFFIASLDYDEVNSNFVTSNVIQQHLLPRYTGRLRKKSSLNEDDDPSAP